MKINQIVGEHKKGFRAKKYARKPVNAIGPKKPPKKPEPIQSQGPVGPGDTKLGEGGTFADAKIVANDGKTITVAMPDGTQIQKPLASALSKDEQGHDIFNMQTKTAMGAPATPEQSPEEKFKPGSDIQVNTGEPIEEEGGDENDPSLATASMPEVNQEPEPAPVAERSERGTRSNVELESMLRIAGLR